jgi:hypothetical protein
MIDPTKTNVRSKDLYGLALNTALAAVVLILLTLILIQTGLVSTTPTDILISTTIFFAIALMNLGLRISEATRLGYQYYYENSLVYAFLSFVISARFYGFIPVLYLGGSRIHVDKLGRTGYGDIGPNHEDLARIASLPLTVNIALCLALIPLAIQSGWFVSLTGLLLAAYTVFSTIPWPYSNGLHILAYNAQRSLFYLASSLILVVFYALI